jgi:hypothetical protein
VCICELFCPLLFPLWPSFGAVFWPGRPELGLKEAMQPPMMQRWVAYHIQPIAASSVDRAELPTGFVSGCLTQGLHRHANHLR